MRSDEAVEFSKGSLLTQTTAFSPPEGILCLPIGARKSQDPISGAELKSGQEKMSKLVITAESTCPVTNVLFLQGLATLIYSITVISLSAVGTGEKSLCQ